MGLINKFGKLGKIAASSIEENIKSKLLEGRIKSIDKKLENMNDKEGAHLIIKKENLQRKMDKEKIEEQRKRDEVKSELKQQVTDSILERKKENKGLNIIQKVQKEFQEIPIATVVNDLAEGLSEVEKAKERIKTYPEDIYSWLELAEALRFYKKAFIIINGIKAPIDLIGSTIDITSELVGGSIESALDKDKWTYERALEQARKLGATEMQIEEFSENYKRNILGTAVKGTGHMVYKQSQKLLKTSERILDFAMNRLLEDEERN